MGNRGSAGWRWRWRFARADVAEPGWLWVEVLSLLTPLFMNASALFFQCFAPVIVFTERTRPRGGFDIAHRLAFVFELGIDPVAKAREYFTGPVQPQPFISKIVFTGQFGAQWVQP